MSFYTSNKACSTKPSNANFLINKSILLKEKSLETNEIRVLVNFQYKSSVQKSMSQFPIHLVLSFTIVDKERFTNLFLGIFYGRIIFVPDSILVATTYIKRWYNTRRTFASQNAPSHQHQSPFVKRDHLMHPKLNE